MVLKCLTVVQKRIVYVCALFWSTYGGQDALGELCRKLTYKAIVKDDQENHIAKYCLCFGEHLFF